MRAIRFVVFCVSSNKTFAGNLYRVWVLAPVVHLRGRHRMEDSACPTPRHLMSKRSRQDSSKQLLELVGQVYDAVLDERLWAGLAPAIASTFDSTSTALHLRNLRKGTVQELTVTANLEGSLWDSYRAHYHKHDIWVRRGAAIGLSRVVTSKDLASDAELQRTEFYDFLRQTDTFYIVGSVLPISKQEIAALGIHRPRNAGTYEDADKDRVAVFLPHLSRALQLRRRLMEADLQHETAIDALGRLRMGVLLVTFEGEIIYSNAQADLNLRKADGIRSVGGRISTTNGRTTERLSGLIRTSVATAAGQEGTAGGAVSVPRSGRLPLSLLVAPFRPARNGFGLPFPSALVFIRDPEGATPATSALQSLFGLTPAEASIAAALAGGQSLEEISVAHGIRVGTARTHLKSILAKTGTNRQAQLVTLLLHSVAVL